MTDLAILFAVISFVLFVAAMLTVRVERRKRIAAEADRDAWKKSHKAKADECSSLDAKLIRSARIHGARVAELTGALTAMETELTPLKAEHAKKVAQRARDAKLKRDKRAAFKTGNVPFGGQPRKAA